MERTEERFSEKTLALMKEAIAEYPRKESAILPVMQLVQKEKGWVSEASMRFVAELLGVTEARAREVATFYTMFHLAPVGKYHLQVCTNISCSLRGAEDVYRVCKEKLGLEGRKQVTPDGLFSLEEVECLAACEKAPAMLLNENYRMDLDPAKMGEIIEGCRRKGGR